MILNLKDFQYNIEQLSKSVNNNAVNIEGLQRTIDDATAAIGALESYLNNLSGLPQEVENLSTRASNLETNMHKWTSVGAVTDVGTYGLKLNLSDFKEMMLLLIYNNSIVGSGTYDLSAFDAHPVTINAPIDSTFKQRLVSITKKSDTVIMVSDLKNLTGVNIYVR